MLKVEIIGHIGADAEVIESDGRKFAKVRVAHTDSWVGSDGVRHESTQWIDCTLQEDAKVIPYLKKGVLLFIRGTLSARVYSSAKDRCYKAGLSVRVMEIQLLSRAKDEQETPSSGEEVHDAPF